jgi:hypothetical protein
MRKQTNTLSPSPKGFQSPKFSDSDFREVRGLGSPKSSNVNYHSFKFHVEINVSSRIKAYLRFHWNFSPITGFFSVFDELALFLPKYRSFQTLFEERSSSYQILKENWIFKIFSWNFDETESNKIELQNLRLVFFSISQVCMIGRPGPGQVANRVGRWSHDQLSF